jgi:hypothetical protein
VSYPTLEQYNEVFQHPKLALTDPELKQATVATTGLGLPLALCGGFALTYTVKCGSKKYAVRCFHKQSNALEKRYGSISNRLKGLRSPYFIDFEFQPQGIRVGGKSFPIVKMAWAAGTTLGEFIEHNRRNRAYLSNLRASLRSLAKYLESQGMAHGDIQTGNVMVSDAGNKIQLIDYDGIFVEELRALGSSELGHRNFQHPKRSASSWDSTLDRFSFICLDLSIRALESDPELWERTRSDGDSVLFKANDFAAPTQSFVFTELIGGQQFKEDAKNFAAICISSFDKIPLLEDFLAKRNIPQVPLSVGQSSEAVSAKYLSAFPVLDATNYSLCLKFVGDKIELVGRIAEVKQDKTRHGKPYAFINFGPWQGSIVKISIWSEGLAALTTTPSASWVGKWVSVIGLMEPPYVSQRYKYSHLSISITQGNQLHFISETEARFRLSGSSTRSAGTVARPSNQELLELFTKTPGTQATAVSAGKANPGSRASIPSPSTSNQAVLQRMRSSQPVTPPASTPRKGSPNKYNIKIPQQPPPTNSNCFIATAVYGGNAPETNVLRRWRDKSLLPHFWGRLLISAYYSVSPGLVPIIVRHAWVREKAKRTLDVLVGALTSRSNKD